MDYVVIAGIILFILLALILVIALINQVNELKQVNIPKKRVTKQYLLEVNELGEIKIREKNPGGGFKYRQF